MTNSPYQVQRIDSVRHAGRPIVCPVCGVSAGAAWRIVTCYLFGPMKCGDCKTPILVHAQSPGSSQRVVLSELCAVTVAFLTTLVGLEFFSRRYGVHLVFGTALVYFVAASFFQFFFDRVSLHVSAAVKLSGFTCQAARRGVLWLCCFMFRMVLGVSLGFHAFGTHKVQYWVRPITEADWTYMLSYAAPIVPCMIMLIGCGLISRLAFAGSRNTELALFAWVCFSATGFVAETELMPPLIAFFGRPGTNHLWANWWPYKGIAPLSLYEKLIWSTSIIVASGFVLIILHRCCGATGARSPSN